MNIRNPTCVGTETSKVPTGHTLVTFRCISCTVCLSDCVDFREEGGLSKQRKDHDKSLI